MPCTIPSWVNSATGPTATGTTSGDEYAPLLVASGVFQSIRPVLVTSTAHAYLGGGGPQVPGAGVPRAGVSRAEVPWAPAWARVAGGLVLACWPATLPQATRVSVEHAASSRRTRPNLMTIGRRPTRARCAAAVTG